MNFRLPKDVVLEADTVNLVGEFNQWNTKATPLKKLKNGTFTTNLELEKGRSYQFRYLIDEQRWENDSQADSYVATPFGDSENCVISL